MRNSYRYKAACPEKCARLLSAVLPRAARDLFRDYSAGRLSFCTRRPDVAQEFFSRISGPDAIRELVVLEDSRFPAALTVIIMELVPEMERVDAKTAAEALIDALRGRGVFLPFGFSFSGIGIPPLGMPPWNVPHCYTRLGAVSR